MDDILGFDFGLKSIGVAIGQRLTLTASPLLRLKAKQGIPNWSEVDKLIKTWQPQELVIGIPLNMDGSEQPITQKAKQFALALKARYHLPTIGVDERLTTIEAREKIFTAQGYKGLTKTKIDQLSAVIIIESYFNSDHKLMKF